MSINPQLRRTAYVPSGATSGVPLALGGGVSADVSAGGTGSGTFSIGILAAAIVGAVAFYVWTRAVQGG